MRTLIRIQLFTSMLIRILLLTLKTLQDFTLGLQASIVSVRRPPRL
jgi:hypothetical protein